MITPKFYKQTDKAWQGYSWRGATVARNGCGPSSVANIVAVLPTLKHTKATPLSVFKYACKKGYMHPIYGTYYAGMTQMLKDYGVKKVIHTSDMNVLKKHLEKGDMAVCLCGKSIFTGSGHYVAAYGIKGDTAYVSDSASSAKARHYPKWTTLRNAILAHPYPQCWIIDNTAQYLGKYKIKFNARGGDGTMKILRVSEGETVKLPANKFKRDGFKFAGWSKGKSNVITLKRFQIGKAKYKNKEKVKDIAKAGKVVKLYACWRGCGPAAAARWARLIAADNSFNYGTGARSHHCGCYYCGTNITGVKHAAKGSKWDKTYCCNPFVWAAYVHGANYAKKCKNSGLSLDWWLKQEHKGKPMFEKIGYNVKYADLKPGDVILKPNHHVKIYVGVVKGFKRVSQARREGWDKGSITTNKVAGRIGKDYIALKAIS